MTLTRNAANALAHDRIRVNGLNLGWSNTPGEHVTQKRWHDVPDDWLDGRRRETALRPADRARRGGPCDRVPRFVRVGLTTGNIVDFDETVVGTTSGQPGMWLLLGCERGAAARARERINRLTTRSSCGSVNAAPRSTIEEMRSSDARAFTSGVIPYLICV